MSFASYAGFGIVNYAGVVKNIRVKAIYYGNYEAGKAERADQLELLKLRGGDTQEIEVMRNKALEAPILDLSTFAELQGWTYAAQAFMYLGTAERLS
ncbi:MAG: TM1812 family CRISPR-associated protein [Haliscomenobacter sp.]|nr:TM1812 family CRISPR-associated protein [Haliscomenobacter sp.]